MYSGWPLYHTLKGIDRGQYYVAGLQRYIFKSNLTKGDEKQGKVNIEGGWDNRKSLAYNITCLAY